MCMLKFALWTLNIVFCSRAEIYIATFCLSIVCCVLAYTQCGLLENYSSKRTDAAWTGCSSLLDIAHRVCLCEEQLDLEEFVCHVNGFINLFQLWWSKKTLGVRGSLVKIYIVSMLILIQSSSFSETKPIVSMNMSFLCEVFECIHCRRRRKNVILLTC